MNNQRTMSSQRSQFHLSVIHAVPHASEWDSVHAGDCEWTAFVFGAERNHPRCEGRGEIYGERGIRHFFRGCRRCPAEICEVCDEEGELIMRIGGFLCGKAGCHRAEAVYIGLCCHRERQKEAYKENEKLPAHGWHHSPYPKIRQIPDVIPLFTR